MTKNVLLIHHHWGTEYAPIGPLYIADSLEREGYNVTFIDSRTQADDVLKIVEEIQPLFVAQSVFTTPTIHKVVDIAQIIKQNTNVPIVWGGVHPTILAEQCLQEPFIDYVIKGSEGEDLIIQLAKDLEQGRNLNQRLRENPAFIRDLDKLQPAWHLVDSSKFLYKEEHSVRGDIQYSRNRVFYYMTTSRGCPFRCTFCYITTVHKSTWRPHSVEWAKKQVQYLKDTHDIDGIGFWDDFFLVDVRRALAITDFLRQNDIGFMCESRATILTDSLMQRLKENNCMQLFIGGESGSPRTLKLIRKDAMPHDFIRAAELGNKYNIPIRISFMFGIPGETVEDMMMTKDLILKLLDYPNVSISGPKLYTPYPGTPSYDDAIRMGFVPPSNTARWKDIHRTTNINLLPWFKTEIEKHGTSKEELFLEIRDKEKEVGIKNRESWYTKLMAVHD